MNIQQELYRHSLSLLTDLYQLTMAYGYWKSGSENNEAVFHLFFRKNPFKSGYSIVCGLDYIIDFLGCFRFDKGDCEFLASLQGNDGRPLFEQDFLEYLRAMEFACDVSAIPEGTVVFPSEPLLKVQGPLIQCQLLETALLNIINFQTLIATKASRICCAARGEPVLEFGLRRAQGFDGSLAASRAAFIGGCAATSNVLAGKLFGIPVRGTHAHSWVMSFDTELDSFLAYARAMPNNCIFLVDTYDSLEGVRRAIEAGRWLREHGHTMIGIRLDSGDLAYLSIEARKMLDAAGFTDAIIVASNDLDEYIMHSLKEQGASIGVWGVGTRLATAYDEPALGGVYKLSAVRKPGQAWQNKIKLSEQSIKTSNPGIQQVRRYRSQTMFIADAIYDISHPISAGCIIVDPLDPLRTKTIDQGTSYEDLLQPVFDKGSLVYNAPSIQNMQQYAKKQLDCLHSGIKRLANPHQYPVGLEKNFHELKSALVKEARIKKH